MTTKSLMADGIISKKHKKNILLTITHILIGAAGFIGGLYHTFHKTPVPPTVVTFDSTTISMLVHFCRP